VKEAVPEKKPDAPSKRAAAPAKPSPAPARTAAAPAVPGAVRKESGPAPATAAPSAAVETEESPAVVAEAAALTTVSFAISPWGEIHVDGKMRGISPPLRNIELPPGQHRIEIKNADSPPHVEFVDAKSGGRIRIRHKFPN
jgi:hypothetical protein